MRVVLTKQQEAASAIDMLVIGAPRENVSEEAMRRPARQLGSGINYTALAPKEFESCGVREDVFLENVWRDKLASHIGPNQEAQRPA